jgi:large subunit ribosomal protein L6
MVVGVSQGFSRTLLINGVGYRAELQGDRLVLNLGYSMPIEYVVPEGLSVQTDGPNKLTLTGMDKTQVGQAAAEIRSLRPPEPYKGKGVKYEDETIVRKVGKAGIK